MQRYQQALQELYRLTAPYYERDIAPIMGLLARDLIATADLSHARTVLDVGTGTGLLLREVAHPTRLAIGVDIAMPMLRVAKSLCKTQQWPNTTMILADANHLNVLSDNSCDVVFASFGLSECAPRQALRAISRVLRPGGQLILQEWGPYDVSSDPRTIIDDTLGAYIGTQADPTLEAFRSLLAEPRPWDSQLQDPDDYVEALTRAGFTHVTVSEDRPVSIPVDRNGANLLKFALAWAPRALELQAMSPSAVQHFQRVVRQRLTDRFASDGLLTWYPLLFRACGVTEV